MSFIPTADVFTWNLIMDLFGQAIQVTHDFFTLDTMDEPFLLDAAEQIWLAFKDNIATNYIANDCVARESVCTSQVIAGAPQATFPIVTGGAGGTTGSNFPNNAALSVKKQSPIRGRSFRGRMYLPGITTDLTNATDPDELAAGIAASLAGDMAQWVADIATAVPSVIPVIVSRFSGIDSNGKPIPRLSGLQSIVEAYTVNNQMDSQRRRLAGRGT